MKLLEGLSEATQAYIRARALFVLCLRGAHVAAMRYEAEADAMVAQHGALTLSALAAYHRAAYYRDAANAWIGLVLRAAPAVEIYGDMRRRAINQGEGPFRNEYGEVCKMLAVWSSTYVLMRYRAKRS